MIITTEQFNEAYKKLPYVLREYIANDELAAISEQMGQEFNLHTDTTGALYRETTNMLLGLINPEQFVAELKSVGIPQENISAIVAELNTKIFIPLRERMQHPEQYESSDEDEEDSSGTSAVAANEPVEWVQVTAAPVTPASTPIPTPTQHMPTPVESAMYQAPVQIPAPQPTQQPQATVAPATTQEFAPLTPPMQPTSPLAPKIQPQKTENRDALHAVLKEYGIDPYREPVE